MIDPACAGKGRIASAAAATTAAPARCRTDPREHQRPPERPDLQPAGVLGGRRTAVLFREQLSDHPRGVASVIWADRRLPGSPLRRQTFDSAGGCAVNCDPPYHPAMRALALAVCGLLASTWLVAAAQLPAPPAPPLLSLRRARHLARWPRNRLRVAGARSGRCPRAAATPDSSSPTARPIVVRCSRRTASAGLHLDSHRRRRHLRADVRYRRDAAPDRRRRPRAARRVVARRPVDLLLDDAARHRGDERHLPRRVDGGTPMPVSRTGTRTSSGPRRRPTGRSLAFAARGTAPQWWRRGSSHLDESEMWTLDLRAPVATAACVQALTAATRARTGRCGAPTAAPVLHVATAAAPRTSGCGPRQATGTDRQLTHFTDGRVLWPTIAVDGRTIAFERDFGDVDDGHGERQGAASGDRCAAHRRTCLRRSACADEPLPGSRAFARWQEGGVRRSRRRLRGVDEGRRRRDARDTTDADRVAAGVGTRQPSPRLRLGAGRGQQIYLYDFGTNTETALTTGDATDLSPVFSPDGKSLAYLRDRQALHVLDLATKQDRVLTTGTSGRHRRHTESGRGRRTASGSRSSRRARRRLATSRLVPIAGGPARPVSFLANVFTNTIAWSHDGTFLLFDTRQRTESGQLARVDLMPRAPQIPRRPVPRSVSAEPTRTRRTPRTLKPREPRTPDPEPEPDPRPRNPGSPVKPPSLKESAIV